MKAQYLKFAKKLIILLAIMFVVDRGLGSIIQYYFENEPLGDAAAFAHAINNPTEDVLIYGSSRAVHTYDTKIITDSLGLSAYNCGRNGSNVVYGSAILPGALEGSHKPKLIIIDIVSKEIAWRSNKDGGDVLASMILPYVLTNEHFEELAMDLFPKELYKAKVSKLYAYNSQVLSIIRNYSRKDNDNINGYQPLPGSKIINPPQEYTADRDGIDEFSKERLEYFIKTVQENHIPLVAVLSPMYTKPFEDNESIRVCKQVFAEHNIELWDYATDPKYVQKDLFYDVNHLNTKGAEMFTRDIMSRIKQEGILKQ
jgi:hypothetical protein